MSYLNDDLNALNERSASEHLQTLYVINGMLKQVEADGLHMDVILPRVLDIAVQQLKATEGSIIVVNQSREIVHAWLTDRRSGDFLGSILDSGVAGEVIRSKKPLVIDDTRSDPRWLRNPLLDDAQQPFSVICTPFLVRDRAIGAMTVHKTGVAKFDDQDRSLLSAISSQAATTIENARLYEASQRQLQVSALLNRASRVINSSLDISKIMQSILAQMNELLNAEAISIALVDREANELVYQVAEGVGSEQIVNLRLPSNIGLSGWVMEHNQAVLVPDTSIDPRFHRLGDQRTGHKTQAMICAPIEFQDTVLGTIQAINPIKGPFTDQDLDLMVNLANVASSAIANAQQFARTQALEERFVSLFQGSVDAILLTDMNFNIVEANNQALAIIGLDRDKLLTMSVFDVHPGRDVLPLASQITGDEAFIFTSQMATRTAEVVHVQVHVKRTQTGNQQLLQWIHHDISKQVELENMRQDLTAMLVHDLQSPLSNVLASLELLIEETPPDSQPTFPLMLDIAMRSSRQLQSLIRSLLDISNLEAGRPISGQTAVQLHELLDEVRDITGPRLEKLGLSLLDDLEPDLPGLFVEEDMIRRVVVNLVDNALKYSQSSTDVIVRAQRSPDNDDQVLLAVVDHGVGVPEQHRARIFEKFQRVSNDSRSKGLGLGLAFCQLAVEAHGGRIWVEETPGGGAMFKLTLPANNDNGTHE